ncbi:9989_t:CDS:2 [Cetraspora pellucida]|uniref:9989_t:CDS:1 n=1 Tax=Cetraspora pellucida TaxID=1433469 RepID=A0A9N9HYL5_9GLOM|nr:9989_t:CDS:2 [Cetraspora pellucida]
MSLPSISLPSSPVSISSTLTEERLTRMMTDEGLNLDDNDLSILCKEKISGLAFLNMTEDRFCSIGLALGPAMALAKFIKSLVNGEDIMSIKQFNPVDYAITEMKDLLCITEGKPRNVKIGYLQNIKQLESSFYMNKRKRTADEAFNGGDYDYLYGIVSTAMNWHFIMFISDGIFYTSNSEYQINFTKKALKGNHKNLRDDIKQIISIIVELLKDRISACDEPKSKKQCIQEKIKNFTK